MSLFVVLFAVSSYKPRVRRTRIRVRAFAASSYDRSEAVLARDHCSIFAVRGTAIIGLPWTGISIRFGI